MKNCIALYLRHQTFFQKRVGTHLDQFEIEDASSY